MRQILAFLLIINAGAAWAACNGRDLIAEMPEAERAALRESAARQPFAEGILWQAERDGRTIRLVGTMHLYDPRHEATLDRIRPFLESADNVLLELGSGDEERLQKMIFEQPDLAFITDGPTLPDLLGDTWADVKDALAERGVPGFLAAKMKPWMAMAQLSMTTCDFDEIRSGKRGLDGMVIAAAEAMGKQAVALEPLDTALKMFSAFSMEEQVQMLLLALEQAGADSADQAVTLAEAYFRQEVQLIWEYSMSQMPDIPGLTPEMIAAQAETMNKVTLVDRNALWMETILGTTGDTVVAVGAMHLPGEAGLLRLLEREGFRITRLALQPG